MKYPNKNTHILLFFFILFLPFVSGAESFKLKLYHAQEKELVLEIRGTNVNSLVLNSFGFDLIYDVSVLKHTSYKQGSLIHENFSFFNVNNLSPGVVRVGGVAATFSKEINDDFIIAYLNFIIISDKGCRLVLANLKDDMKNWVPASIEYEGNATRSDTSDLLDIKDISDNYDSYDSSNNSSLLNNNQGDSERITKKKTSIYIRNYEDFSNKNLHKNNVYSFETIDQNKNQMKNIFDRSKNKKIIDNDYDQPSHSDNKDLFKKQNGEIYHQNNQIRRPHNHKSNNENLTEATDNTHNELFTQKVNNENIDQIDKELFSDLKNILIILICILVVLISIFIVFLLIFWLLIRKKNQVY